MDSIKINKTPQLQAVQRQKNNFFHTEAEKVQDTNFFQAKLSISASNSPYEREADAVASQVMRKGSKDSDIEISSLSNTCCRSVQTKCDACEKEEQEGAIQRKSSESSGTEAPESVTTALKNSGQPMDHSTQSFMEKRMGYDFSSVRIHNDSQAHESSATIQAQAYTHQNHIVFASGKYTPQTTSGKQLLAHELTHVVQQGSAGQTVQKKDPDPDKFEAFDKGSSDIKEVMKVFRSQVHLYFIVNGNTMDIYDAKGSKKSTYVLDRPGKTSVNGYFVGNFNLGWYIVKYNKKGEAGITGVDSEMLKKVKTDPDFAKDFETLNIEMDVGGWIQNKDMDRFNKDVPSSGVIIGLSVVSDPVKEKTVQNNEGPNLNFTIPSWFAQLKTKLDQRFAVEKKGGSTDYKGPDKIFYYGSDKVQEQKGTDAWTIEVQKEKRAAFYTIQKKQWDDAPDKDAFADQVMDVLHQKIQILNDKNELEKEEQKEITDIDSTGGKEKGNKWAWAITLKKKVEAALANQKLKEPQAKDFPDQLSIAVQDESAYFRVSVYKGDQDNKDPKKIPEMVGGALPQPLSKEDKPEDWIIPLRKAAAALKVGAVTSDSSKADPNAPTSDMPVLPAYPAEIEPKDISPDRTTVPTAKNNFRMSLHMEVEHGSNLLNLVTINMGMTTYYSWKVFPLPDELKTEKDNPQISSAQLIQDTNDYILSHDDLGQEKDSYQPDYDWDQKVSMEGLGLGEFLLYGQANIRYPSDYKYKRATSKAGFPFTIRNAEDIASSSAFADSDALAKLKKELAQTQDEKRKKELEEQIKDMEDREKTPLVDITKKDAEETQKIITAATKLKKYIQDDRSRKLPFKGDKTYNPFMFRLKDFDKELYSVYIMVRQVYDYHYDDITAIDEYIKSMQQQLDELQRMEKRIGRVTTGNDKFSAALPVYRVVGALVKESDGNLVPLTLLVGYHKDSDPQKGKYKMMVFDVTFDSPKKGDMTYAGDESSTLEEGIHSAFIEFGKDNKYGDGKIVYRVPQLGYKGQADSVTTALEYLGYAVAAIGITLLLIGTFATGGALAPATAAAIGAVATYLGIAVAVVGAILAARNIYKRVEKGTFEIDAEFAMDAISILAAFVQVAGAAGKGLMAMSKTVDAATKIARIQRLQNIIAIYDVGDIVGNVVILGWKVESDVKAVKALNLPADQEAQMMQQIAMEAVQQGAMLAFASVNKVKDIHEAIQTKIEESHYKTFQERGWLDEKGVPTEEAPPFLRDHATEPGKAAPAKNQGEQAWKESKVMDMASKPTADGEHQLTVTENGRIIRCSDFCTDLRLKYGEVLGHDPELNAKMTDLEKRAQLAAKSGNKEEAAAIANEANGLESQLKQAEDLRKHLFGMSDDEINDAVDTMGSEDVTGGKKSGYKIEGTKIPKRQRRLIDVTDIMTPEEIASAGGYKKAMERINGVMGKKISDIPELEQHWNKAREEVLKGKNPSDYDREKVIDMYKDAQRKFWQNVRKDPKAVEFLKRHGFVFEGEGGAALAELGPKGQLKTDRGVITNQERRISLDHIEEKAQKENWLKALDADNLELMFQNANSQKEIVQVKFKMRKTAGVDE